MRFAVALFVALSLVSPSSWGRGEAPASRLTQSGQAIPEIAVVDLPREARETLDLIEQGGPFPRARDGAAFGNLEQRLPLKARGYYREYTVPTPQVNHRGARRIVTGRAGERYYTDDHYQSFKRIKP
jgi:ribonuclease T1